MGDIADRPAAGYSKVWLWDTGPAKPEEPEPPTAPREVQDDPAYELAMVQFWPKLTAYDKALTAYIGVKAAYDAWHEINGEMVEFCQWAIDAKETMAFDDEAVKEGRQPGKRFYYSTRKGV